MFSQRWLLLCCLIVLMLATACGTLQVNVVAPTAEPPTESATRPTAEPVTGLATRADARPGVPPTPTAWFSELPFWAKEASVNFDDRMKLIGFTGSLRAKR